MKHILIEFKDGSLQWIKCVPEKNLNEIEGFKRIKAESYGEFIFPKKRWKESKESQFKIEQINY